MAGGDDVMPQETASDDVINGQVPEHDGSNVVNGNADSGHESNDRMHGEDHRQHDSMDVTSKKKKDGAPTKARGNGETHGSKKKKDKSHLGPEQKANYISQAFYSWSGGLVWKGFRNELSFDDIAALPAKEQTKYLLKKYDTLVKRPKKNGGKRSFGSTIFRMVRAPLIESGFLHLMYVVSQIVQPLFIREIIKSVDVYDFNGLYYIIGSFLAQSLGSLANQRCFHLGYKMGEQMRATTMALVYRQSMSISGAALGNTSAGEMADLLNNDPQKFYDLMPDIHRFWACPLQIVVVSGFLYYIIGVASLFGILTLFLLVPVTLTVISRLRKLRGKHMPCIDDRVSIQSEIINGIRAVKFFSWEDKFYEKVRKLRKREFGFIKQELNLFIIQIIFLVWFPIIAMAITFYMYANVFNTILVTADVFAALSYFTAVKFPIIYTGNAVMNAVNLRVGIKRVSKFLDREDIPTSNDEDEMVNATSDGKTMAHGDSTNGSESVEMTQIAKDNNAFSDNKDVFISMRDAVVTWAVTNEEEAREETDTKTHKKKSKKGKKERGKKTEEKIKEKTEDDDTAAREFTLKNLNFNLKQGELCGIVGAVGAGKTMLIESLLDELVIAEGSMKKNVQSVAYVQQEPWIKNDSVRDNILFGKPFDKTKYERVLTACCLWQDLKQWKNGDATMIGERGVTLSGGQKARVSLARAAYSEAELILFDDPLSALDADTGRRVFNMLLGPHGILSSSIRLLVTHAVQYMSIMDKVMVLFEGRQVFFGPHSQLESIDINNMEETNSNSSSNNNTDLSPSIPNSDENLVKSDKSSEGGEEGEGDDKKVNIKTLSSLMILLKNARQETQDGSLLDSTPVTGENRKSLHEPGTDVLMTKEALKAGAISTSTYLGWLRHGGGLLGWFLPWLFLVSLERAIFICNDLWLQRWCQAPPKEGDVDVSLTKDLDFLPYGSNLDGTINKAGNEFFGVGYFIIAIASFVFNAGPVWVWFVNGVKAARSLHNATMRAVLKAPIHFFETTPVGRIVNRFSFDTEIVDYTLIERTNAWVASTMWILSAILTMALVLPLSLAVNIPCMIIFAGVQHIYSRSAVQIQRMDAVSRSPIQAHAGESINGRKVIRAYGRQFAFIEQMDDMVDKNNSCLFAFTSCQRWLSIRLDLIGNIITLGVCILSWVLAEGQDQGLTASGGTAGVAIQWSLNLTLSFFFYVNFSCESKARLASVERMLDYSTGLESERYAKDADTQPKSWPERGEVEFKNVSLTYRKGLPPALKNFNVKIRPGERVGIVGRTGAGKSTIAVAIFRLVDLLEGQILVDGRDLAQMRLDDVRGRGIAVIPQDPVLFEGTIRSNLDPFDEFEDVELWSALNTTGANAVVKTMGGGLHAKVDVQGSNLSVGEKQMLCLSRALLIKPRVLVLDESTASVDGETDQFLREAIRKAFGGKTTMLEVAHRLDSIIDSDRVLVMEAGSVKEFDTPANLMANKDSAFSKLLSAGQGKKMEQEEEEKGKDTDDESESDIDENETLL